MYAYAYIYIYLYIYIYVYIYIYRHIDIYKLYMFIYIYIYEKIYIYIYMYICKYRMRETVGKPVGDLWRVGGRLGGVWLAGWGWFGGLWSLTQSLAGRGPGQGGSGALRRVRKMRKVRKCETNIKIICVSRFC